MTDTPGLAKSMKCKCYMYFGTLELWNFVKSIWTTHQLSDYIYKLNYYHVDCYTLESRPFGPVVDARDHPNQLLVKYIITMINEVVCIVCVCVSVSKSNSI